MRERLISGEQEATEGRIYGLKAIGLLLLFAGESV